MLFRPESFVEFHAQAHKQLITNDSNLVDTTLQSTKELKTGVNNKKKKPNRHNSLSTILPWTFSSSENYEKYQFFLWWSASCIT